MSTPAFKKQKTSHGTYFPEETFRNIASFLIDPYKKDKERHATVWKTIRVKRERVSTGTYADEDEDQEVITIQNTDDEYCLYVDGELSSQITTIFHKDDCSDKLDNVIEHVRTLSYSEWEDNF